MKRLLFSILLLGIACAFADVPGEKQDVPGAPVPVGDELQQKASVAEAVTAMAGNRDCPQCPEMVAIPSGSFAMGAKKGYPPPDFPRSRVELPVHTVNISTPFRISKNEISFREYTHFAKKVGKTASKGACPWLPPGATPSTVKSYPVVCVSKKDAEEYTGWLTKETGFNYRLPSESEWEYAARGGSETLWYWGDTVAEACRYENVADAVYALAVASFSTKLQTFSCDDKHLLVSPVGTYEANPFGLLDVLGNAREWVADCWSNTYRGHSVDGSARKARGKKPCKTGVQRGGSFVSGTHRSRAAYRLRAAMGSRSALVGFRVVREVSNDSGQEAKGSGSVGGVLYASFGVSR